MKRLTRALIGLTAASLAASVQAQEATTWDVQSEGSDRLIASVLFDNGPGLAIQCSDGAFDFALVNLPPAPRGGSGSRILETGSDLATLEDSSWQAEARSSTALAFTAARRVRALRKGGVFYVRTPAAEGEPTTTFALPLPTDSVGIDRVLEACGKPLVEPRDDLPEINHLLEPTRWALRPFELYPPARALRAGGGMTQVEVSCLIAPEGRVRDCRIESERPAGMGVGDGMLRDAGHVRLNFGDNAEAAVGGIIYMTVTSQRR